MRQSLLVSLAELLVITALAGTPAGLMPRAMAQNDSRREVKDSVCDTLYAPACIVHIVVDGVGCGTGILLQDGRVLTASHVVQLRFNGQQIPVHVYFGGRNGRPLTDGALGRNVGIWVSDMYPGMDTGQLLPNGDLAIISGLAVPEWAKGVPLAREAVKDGDLLTSVGLERPEAVRVHAAPMTGRDTSNPWVSKPYFRIGVSAQRGDSGGPVFNQNGELVGINSAIGEGFESHVTVTPSTRLDLPNGGWIEFPGSVSTTFEHKAYTSVTDLSRFNAVLNR